MHLERQHNPDFEKVAELVGQTKFAMMTTLEEDGALHSRPMATMEMDAEGNLWFFTSAQSSKVEDAMKHRQVNFSYARTDKQDYLSICGTSTVVRDREKMKQLWTPWIKPWFPNGLDDPDLVLLCVRIRDAQYWDAPGNIVMRIAGLAKAIATGNHDGLGENRKVERR